MSAASNVVMFDVVLFGEGNEDHTCKRPDIEGGIACGRVRIGKLSHQGYARCISAVGVESSFPEIGGEQHGPVGSHDEGDALVNRCCSVRQRLRRSAEGGAPSCYSAILAGKNEEITIESALAVVELTG